MSPTAKIIQHGSLDDLLFRGKNKAYGAYALRQDYTARLGKSFYLFFIFLGSIIVIYTVYERWMVQYFYSYVDTSNGILKEQTRPMHIEIPEVKNEQVTVSSTEKSIVGVNPEIVESLALLEFQPKEENNLDKPIHNAMDAGQVLETNSHSGLSTSGVLNTSGNVSNTNDTDEVLDFSEIEPQFPGDLNKFLISKIEFPDICRELGYTKALVIVGFIVNEDGSISNIHLEKAEHESFNEQALSAVYAMPKWIPGSNYGQKVKVNMSIPFNFILDI